MPLSRTKVSSAKAERYMASLRKHFARKVVVISGPENNCTIQFEMGQCEIRLDTTDLHFECVAETHEALDIVRYIVDQHIIKLGDFKGLTLEWVTLEKSR